MSMRPSVVPLAPPQMPTVGIWTPFSPAPALFPRRFARAVEAMRQQGMRIQWSALAASNDGLAAGSPSELADDLHQLLSDPQVDMVICATGGHTTLPVLPYIDFTLVAQCRKPIVGFSDVTAFLWAALKMSSLITFHGPMVLSEWGEVGGLPLYTTEFLWRVLRDWRGPIELVPPEEWTDEFLFWDKEDTRLRRSQGPASWRCLIPGDVTGWILPGCLPTASTLFGTPYMPEADGAILFLETLGMSAPEFYGMLSQWDVSGALDGVVGLVIGRQCCPSIAAGEMDLFDRVILSVLGTRQIPVLVDVDFGHTDPRLTLPVGGVCHLDAGERRLTLLKSSVADRPSAKPG